MNSVPTPADPPRPSPLRPAALPPEAGVQAARPQARALRQPRLLPWGPPPRQLSVAQARCLQGLRLQGQGPPGQHDLQELEREDLQQRQVPAEPCLRQVSPQDHPAAHHARLHPLGTARACAFGCGTRPAQRPNYVPVYLYKHFCRGPCLSHRPCGPPFSQPDAAERASTPKPSGARIPLRGCRNLCGDRPAPLRSTGPSSRSARRRTQDIRARPP